MAFPINVSLSMVSFSLYGNNVLRNTRSIFWPLFVLQCYSQVATIVTFISDCSVKRLFSKCFRYSERKKLHKKIVLPKLQKTTYGTRTDVHLDPSHALLAPTCRQRPELTRNITLRRNVVKQLLGLFVNEKYVTKTSTAFTFCENIGRRNMEQREVQELKALMLHS